MTRRKPAGVVHRSVIVVTDQGVSSATNICMTLAVAKSIGAEGFGAYSIALVLYVICLGLSRALSTDWLMVVAPRQTDAVSHMAARGALGLSLTVGLATGVLLAIASLLVTAPVSSVFLVLSLILPALMLQDAWRFISFARGRPADALVSDIVWALGVATAIIVSIQGDWKTPAPYLASWGTAAAVGAMAGLVLGRMAPNIRLGITLLQMHRALVWRFAADFLVYALGAQVTLLLVSIFLGVGDVGALQGAQTLLGPVTSLLTGVSFAAVAEGARVARDPALLRRRTVRLTVCLVSACAVWATALCLLPPSVGKQLLGDSWIGARAVLPAVAVGALAGALAASVVAGLRALADARRALRVRLCAAPASVLLTATGALLWALQGAAIGQALASILGATMMLVAFFQSSRPTNVTVPKTTPGPTWSVESDQALL